MKFNNCVLVGRLVKDPEMRKTTSGKDVAQFTLAIDDINDAVDFANCEAWSNTATTISRYCHKGDEIGVIGRFRNRKESDEKYHPRFVVERFEFGAKKRSEQQSDAFDTVDDIAESKKYPDLQIQMDELPF